jgi:orotate phosphoribosyltransferase
MVIRMRKLGEMIKQKAVKTGEFTLTSGKKSSYYIDIKKVSTDPRVLKEIVKEMKKEIEGEEIDRIAGMAVGAVPLATALSLETQIPFVIIRKEKKEHGTGKRIEGEIRGGESVVVIEDVTTTGGSALAAVKAVREKNCTCNKVIVVVDRLKGAKELLEKENVSLIPLVTIKDLGLR